MFGQQVLLTNENPASLGKQSHETWLEQNRPRFLWCTGFNRSLKLNNSCCAPSPVPWCQAAPHRGAHRRDWAGPSLSVWCSVMQGASQFKVMGFVLSTFLSTSFPLNYIKSEDLIQTASLAQCKVQWYLITWKSQASFRREWALIRIWQPKHICSSLCESAQMVSSAIKTETARDMQRFSEALGTGVLQNLKELPDSN